MRECHDGAQSGHRVGVLREQHDYPSNERAPIRVWIQSEDAELRSRLLQELAEHAGIEAHVGSILDRSRLSAGRDEEPRHVILLHDRAFAAMARESREAVCALAANHAVLLLLDTVNGDIVHEILRNRFRGYLLTACAGDSVAKAVHFKHAPAHGQDEHAHEGEGNTGAILIARATAITVAIARLWAGCPCGRPEHGG